MREKIVFKEGLFTTDGDESFLLGNQCGECNQLYFPTTPYCFECRSNHLTPVKFGNKGTLYSYTISHLPSERFQPPYVAGWVDCREGIRVFAPLFISDRNSLHIGMDLKLIIRELWMEKNTPVMAYMYKPA